MICAYLYLHLYLWIWINNFTGRFVLIINLRFALKLPQADLCWQWSSEIPSRTKHIWQWSSEIWDYKWQRYMCVSGSSNDHQIFHLGLNISGNDETLSMLLAVTGSALAWNFLMNLMAYIFVTIFCSNPVHHLCIFFLGKTKQCGRFLSAQSSYALK